VDHRRRKEKKKIGAVGGIWQRWIKMYITHGGSKESCCCVECVFIFIIFLVARVLRLVFSLLLTI
jgi:hypothetical protein